VSRADRLDLLLRVLRDRPGITAPQLAERVGASTRSVFRDLGVLRERGYPIESSRGRGGGLRLHPLWGLGRVPFSAEDALATLLGLAVAEGLGLPVFGDGVRSARARVVSAFPSSEHQRLRRLRARLLVGPPASDAVRSSYGAPEPAAMRELQAAFVRDRVMELEYQKPDEPATRRRVEPHALLLNWPAWYLLSHDRLRQDVRTFRLDRIRAVRGEAEIFVPRPAAVVGAIGGAEFAQADRWAL
jgi:predicted DNA-binding transcriptional regulator YafY